MTPTNAPAEPVVIADLVEALHRRYPSVELPVLRDEVLDAAEGFKDASVFSFLPILIERRVRRDLDLARPR